MKNLASLVRASATILSERAEFASDREWLIRWLDGAMNRLPGMGRIYAGKFWRVRLRALPQPVVVRRMSKDWVAVRETFFRREYGFLEDLIECDPRHVLDLGANIGMTVRLWLHRFPDARVVAVEPDPDNFLVCSMNLDEADGASRAQLHNCCVAARAGLQFLDRSTQPMAYRVRPAPAAGTIEVPARTVEEIIRASGLDSVDLLKCDIEGAEEEIFRDCSSWIHRVGLLVVELHRPYDHARLIADLTRNGVRPTTRTVKRKGASAEVVAVQVAKAHQSPARGGRGARASGGSPGAPGRAPS